MSIWRLVLCLQVKTQCQKQKHINKYALRSNSRSKWPEIQPGAPKPKALAARDPSHFSDPQWTCCPEGEPASPSVSSLAQIWSHGHLFTNCCAQGNAWANWFKNPGLSQSLWMGKMNYPWLDKTSSQIRGGSGVVRSESHSYRKRIKM